MRGMMLLFTYRTVALERAHNCVLGLDRHTNEMLTSMASVEN
jgi:hypothetical protein